MPRLKQVMPEFVEFIPDRLEPAVLYVSRKYSTATHLCCCGCGLEVVTPLNPAKWSLFEHNGTVSLRPSIGNWGFPCRSHYWIVNNGIRWAGSMSAAQIAQVKARDRRDAKLVSRGPGTLAVMRGRCLAGWNAAIKFISGLWKR